MNDPLLDIVHKFEIDPITGKVTEVGGVNGIPWLSGIVAPHGLGQDVNGNLYIGELDGPNGDQFWKIDCSGNVLDASYIADFGYNTSSYNGILYNNYFDRKITAYDLCDASNLGSISLDACLDSPASNWGFDIGSDGTMYSTTAFSSSTATTTTNDIWVIKPTIDDFANGTSFSSTFCNLNSTILDRTEGRLLGITSDDNGHLFVVMDYYDNPRSTCVVKYDLVGNELGRICDATGGDGGFFKTMGIEYSASSGMLYLGARGNDDCIAMIDPVTMLYAGAALENEPSITSKALKIVTECCPAELVQSIKKTVCAGDGTGIKYFLNDVLSCGGPICESEWVEVSNTSGGTITYNSCNQSVDVSGTSGCAVYNIKSDGVGAKRCGAFDITMEICVDDCNSVSPCPYPNCGSVNVIKN